MLFSLFCAAASLYAGLDLAQTYGTSPGDGGVLAPLGQRLAWGIFVSLLGVGFAFGMWVYGRCYVSEIALDESRQLLLLRTVSFLGDATVELPLDAQTSYAEHRGRLRTTRQKINAPWISLRVPGRRIPMIVDAQGEFVDEDGFVKHVLKQAA